MNIAASDFDSWLENIAQGTTLTDISAQAGLSLSTVSGQRSGDRITAKTIIAIARAYHFNPVHQLAQFEGYETLRNSELTLIDALALYSPLDLLHQHFVREGRSLPGAFFAPPEACLRRWLELNCQSVRQKDLAQVLGMRASNFSRQITEGTLPIYRLLKLAAELGAPASPALVAAGYLHFEEVFGRERKEYLSSRSDEELLKSLERAMLFLSAS